MKFSGIDAGAAGHVAQIVRGQGFEGQESQQLGIYRKLSETRILTRTRIQTLTKIDTLYAAHAPLELFSDRLHQVLCLLILPSRLED